MASSGDDGTVRLWNLDDPTAPPIEVFDVGTANLVQTFSPDGSVVASYERDNRFIRLSIADTANLADMVCERVWRNLTRDEWWQFVGSVGYQATCPLLVDQGWSARFGTPDAPSD